MRALILAMTIFAFSTSLFAKGDDGWSSSGGGEYIINQNNPWFMGIQVKWCIDYGGEDKFSLPFELAKAEVAKGIATLSTQLSQINRHKGSIHQGDFRGQTFWLTKTDVCSSTYEDFCRFIADQYTYTANCEEANLEIILGNYNNEKVQKLIADIGVERFKKIAGISIRTEYYEQYLNGKGFIYIAADKGDLQYAGSRSTIFKSSTIWDNHEKISPNAPIPDRYHNAYYINDFDENLKLKDWTMGVLAPVVSHELGHVLGFVHNHYGNIMDEDYPANIINTGLVFKGNFQRDSMILSRGLIESDMTRQIGYSAIFQKKHEYSDLSKGSSTILKFMYDFPENYKGAYSTPIFFIFDFNSITGADKGTIRIATIGDNKLEYKVHKQSDIEFINCTPPENLDSINFRTEKVDPGAVGYTYDPESKTWTPSYHDNVKTNQTLALLAFDNNYLCGKISLSSTNKKKFISFRLTLSYYGHSSKLELIDPDNGFVKTFDLSESSIFGQAGDPLPPVSYNFYWL